MKINQVETGVKGAFEALENEEKAGTVTYTWAGQDKIIIDHTEVAETFGGQGVGKALVMAAVDFARAKNIKIMPLCPYAKSVFQKDKTLEDVLF